jgi:2-keto-4-pentenoate hydratase
VTHIGIYDALTGGNLLFHGALTVPKTVTTGDTMQINAGALTITME